MRFAVLFPGQGSQYVGMGKALADTFFEAARAFQHADEVLGRALSDLCFYGPEQDLMDTANSQPAIFVTSMAAWYVFRQHLHVDQTDLIAFAGHSLGEYSALTAAGALDFVDALHLVATRGTTMRDAGKIAPGGMLAVLGVDLAIIQKMCQDIYQSTGKVIEVANDNCPGQAVVAGEREALAAFENLCRQQGFIPPRPLKVSIAPHTSLMKPAIPEFLKVLSFVSISAPEYPVLGNISADWLETSSAVREDLQAQLTHAVRWTHSMQSLIHRGCEAVVQMGPGKVLTDLMRRIDRNIKRVNFGDDPNDLSKVITMLTENI